MKILMVLTSHDQLATLAAQPVSGWKSLPHRTLFPETLEPK
jgi:hypothetical protein